MIAIILSACLFADSPKTLRIGEAEYLPGPALRVGDYLTSQVFSRDGKWFSAVDMRPEGSYAAQKEFASGEMRPPSSEIVRFDLRSGTRTRVYSPEQNETLMRLETVGQGGDLIGTIAVGVPDRELLTWKAVYGQVGRPTQVLISGPKARSFDVVASEQEQKACILICGPDVSTRVLFLSNGQTKEITLPEQAFQGGFFSRTELGNPILSLQGAPPGYRLLGSYEFDFNTGEARRLPTLPDAEQIQTPSPLVEFDQVLRSQGDQLLGQTPLRDIFARPAESRDPKETMLFVEGALGIIGASSEGYALHYLTSEGYFVKELVKQRKPR